MALSTLFVVIFVLIVAERALEIAIHRRNAARLRARGATWLGARDGFAMILVAQLLLFFGTLAEVAGAPWAGVWRWTWPFLALLILTQALRYWCITTLGDRWSIRVVTVIDAPRVTRGPYRWIPHPNYVAVMVEAIALPLAFGAFATALVAGAVQAIALFRRIRIEEAALRSANAIAQLDA